MPESQQPIRGNGANRQYHTTNSTVVDTGKNDNIQYDRSTK